MGESDQRLVAAARGALAVLRNYTVGGDYGTRNNYDVIGAVTELEDALADAPEPPNAYDGPRTISELPTFVEGGPIKSADILRLGEVAAMITPATLTAAEITEPGWYWYRGEGRVCVVEIDSCGVWFVGNEYSISGTDLTGTFIGPLREPE